MFALRKLQTAAMLVLCAAPLMAFVGGQEVNPPAEAPLIPELSVIQQFEIDRSDRMTVPVRINNSEPVDFIVDTGAERTVISGDLAKRLAELEDKTEALAMNHDTFSHNTRAQLKKVFDALRELMTPPDPPKRPVGFITPEDKGKKTQASRSKG